MERQRGILSVSQLNDYLKMLLDGDPVLSSVWVRGEISNFTIPRSGHFYFTLKDEEGQVRAVMFRGSASHLIFRPEDGMKVIARGRVSVYGASGQYQLYVDEMQPDGAGALALRFEQLKKKLAAEGLFDASRKKPLPFMPARVGVITSPTGAAVRDMINILGRRFPATEMILFPAAVQGAEAVPQLTLGIEFFGACGFVDVIIIGRGGGSAEDLWAFNDEGLARAIAACPVPVISAVGHESDFTICDFVADCRAPTPSAAAELAVPDRGELLQGLAMQENRLHALIHQRMKQARSRVEQLRRARVLEQPNQWLDGYRMCLLDKETQLQRTQEQLLEKMRVRLAQGAGKLNALSPLSVLTRGYTTVRDGNGQITRASGLTVGQDVSIRFADGEAVATVRAVHPIEEEN